MALSEKGSRKVTVDSVQYRYRVTSGSPQQEVVVVQVAEGPGQRLVVKLDFSTSFGDRTARPILPGFVVKLIRAAGERGWTPLADGKPCEYGLRDLLPDDPPPLHRNGLSMDTIEIRHPAHGELLLECLDQVWCMARPLTGEAEPWAVWEAIEFLSDPPYDRPPATTLERLTADFDENQSILVRSRKTDHASRSRFTDQLAIGPSDGRRTVFRFLCWPDRQYVAAGDWRSVFERCPRDWLK